MEKVRDREAESLIFYWVQQATFGRGKDRKLVAFDHLVASDRPCQRD